MDINIGIIIGAALADSINPCVFGVLIFLLAFMTKVFKTPAKMLFGGLFYALVVYATYLAIGFGILKFLQTAISPSFSSMIYMIAAGIAIIAGILEIKDYFWYGRGFTLQMIPGASERIKTYAAYIERLERVHPSLSILMIGALGIFVVLVELPCTGAPYFAILGLLHKGAYASAVPYLLLYNFVFILPLFVIIAIAYFGTASDRLETWRQDNKGIMRLGVGIFLIALGSYMIYSLGSF
ncbi:MAG: hypothetical protein A3I44_06105 [Candidatus Sungbacteria bacterium RIFCSPLOWO2_02_FULL_51_17]|uniref:Cytochrome C biogenesis protein transmembrane domain-containing protein n=1 Tax=Candidatus Sungbacteria bacterium RIFCSPHIGHO2_02_FULL_51_29 TaxID=1802273 RepID=A0A1G2KWM6_9BACT|nr:MAG: hypothetical protein A2676_04420 [Candidatus Sungbacteria bacterium RIFCSPHIGHO2_01_FULL_51_22]OHA03845.1 MAG: hypothetical protein A3C16_05165 [Candidatus Sungbacteria bacterium RIFCSPHIGHO2_02_FULL_51_29]OHA05944.1 MAG: hypothetical protein A3B29_02495 [Candidatus Sungbacteria bacterium RIFCSPLOWO2_01_FULL_51_34]OHA10350.1 MAG: hypothetical protein A3I44_06105 [Candidatus Sungbacteria bacterium RIFCSPLOWO2_02_FULL_51_17]